MDFFRKQVQSIRTERFFVLIASVFGTLILLLTPPFQVPDEPNHFLRAWQISDGGFISVKQDKRVGGDLPLSLDVIAQPFYSMIWTKDRKLKDVGMKNLLKTPLNADEKRFYDFNNTALYSPVCYAPSALILFILKPFSFSPLYNFYAARMASLFFWIIVIYFAIRIIPFYKWLFCLLALLPMSLFISMSISADVVTNALCFFLIALVFKYAYEDGLPLSQKQFLWLCLLVLLVASIKAVYVPVILILFIIPSKKFGDKKTYFLKIGGLFLLAGLTFLSWNAVLSPLYISRDEYNEQFRDVAAVAWGANMPEQIKFILHNGTYIFDVMLASLSAAFDMYFPGYIGTFGWLDLKLPVWMIYALYFFILFIAVTDGSAYRMKIFHRVLFALTAIFLFGLVLLSQHLIWDPVGGDKIMNIQGRYLIPVFPFVFLLLHNRFTIKKLTAPITMLTVLLFLSYSIFVLYTRYH